MIKKEIAQVNETGFYSNRYGFFSRAGFEDIAAADKEQLILFSLDNLY